MRIVLIIFILLSLVRSTSISASENPYTPWVMYYSDQASVEIFQPYNLIVFDSDYHPPLNPLIKENKMLIGYLSLGEAESDRDYFYDIKRKGILLKENKHWPGSYVIDIRSTDWTQIVIETLIPRILNKGFKGIFLDTLDSPLELERENPNYYRGMKEAAIHLIQTIRMNYPGIKIMVNRGYEVLPDIAPYIDMQLGESIYTDFDNAKQEYNMINPYLYQQQVKLLKHARRINPQLSIFTLDYWNPEDTATIKSIYETQVANGFNPYVSTLMLDTVVARPE